MKDKDTFKTTVDGVERELTVIAPTAKISNEAQLVHAASWARASKPLRDATGKIIREAAPLRIEIEQSILPEHDGLWNKEKEEKYKEVSMRVLRNDKRLKGGANSFKNLGEAVSVAWEMRADRNELLHLRMVRNSLNENSAENFADLARLNYLIYACTQDSGKPFYKSLDEYYQNMNEVYSMDAATALLKLMNDIDDIDKTPENEFLYQYGFVDEKYRRVNSDGALIDDEGKLINEFGQYIDDIGNLIDIDGDVLTDEGDYKIEFADFVDENGDVIAKRG